MANYLVRVSRIFNVVEQLTVIVHKPGRRKQPLKRGKTSQDNVQVLPKLTQQPLHEHFPFR